MLIITLIQLFRKLVLMAVVTEKHKSLGKDACNGNNEQIYDGEEEEAVMLVVIVVVLV